MPFYLERLTERGWVRMTEIPHSSMDEAKAELKRICRDEGIDRPKTGTVRIVTESGNTCFILKSARKDGHFTWNWARNS